jgi:D-alanyl-D-alanine carboxypeptidase/D-alanyl-D-alanine-endopeptidase (penicillin-binding protein 4)
MAVRTEMQIEKGSGRYDIMIAADPAVPSCSTPDRVIRTRKLMSPRRPKLRFLIVFASALVFVSGGLAVKAQMPPLLQPITVYSEPKASPTPLVLKTGSANAIGEPAVLSTIKTSIPVLAEMPIPGHSGVLVESLAGSTVIESQANVPFNPASNVKIATSYAVLKSFGPGYRFPTNVWTDGSLDASTGTLNGNVYVSGRDPVFGYEHAISIAHELNRLGVRTVQGDLVVTDNFTMNYSSSVQRSADVLFTSLDNSKRSAASVRVWTNFVANSGRVGYYNSMPSVTFSGAVYVQSMPSTLNLLFSHESAPMRDIVKAMMCYSNNFLSERLGDMLGGPYAIARIVQQDTGSIPSEFYIQTASGLGINRVTPAAMMKLLRAFRKELAKNRMTFADIMPVAGLDDGTLEGRFANDYSRGSVVGKTGTLGQTDGGVSALAGEINTRDGRFLFVIFNMHGGVSKFRGFQNNYISLIQGQFGGPVSLGYMPVSLEARLAKTKISYPAAAANVN